MAKGWQSERSLLRLLRQNKAVPQSRPAKSNSRYWKERVFRPTYSRGNKQYQLPEYSVRIQVGGRREVFALKTPVRDQAAARARDIYLRILSHGMDVATEEEKTHVIPKSAVLTFGDYFTALEHHAEIKPRTGKHSDRNALDGACR